MPRISRNAARIWRGAFLAAALAAAITGCNKGPAEPDAPGASTPMPTVAPLLWDVPGAWAAAEVPKGGQKRAEYKVPKTGNDKDDGELTVAFFGTGSEGDETRRFKEAFAQFDGDVGATAARERFDVGPMKVESVDVAGTFKIPMARPLGPSKRSPVEMVKQNYRMLLAVVKTPDRGNWFFKLIGPDETVQAARPGFKSVLQSVK
jgi:hypothetical protein